MNAAICSVGTCGEELPFFATGPLRQIARRSALQPQHALRDKALRDGLGSLLEPHAQAVARRAADPGNARRRHAQVYSEACHIVTVTRFRRAAR